MTTGSGYGPEGGKMDKGKNFSRNRAKADRMEADFYQTPYCLTQAFVDRHIKVYWEPDKEEKTICDYCSGSGAIVKVLNDSGFRVISGDIRDSGKMDFFNIGKEQGDEYGLMNPPFRIFNQWAEHCFKVFSVSFALLAPTTYLQGVKRYNKKHQDGIFQNQAFPLTHIYTFNRYPMLSENLRPDGLIETGMQALSWFVWTRRSEAAGYAGDTIHRWLDIDCHVWRKGKRGKA
jgi:hypothetical protein